MSEQTNHWTIEQALETYNVGYWSDGYFSIGPQGDVVVSPDPGQTDRQASLQVLTQQLRQNGLQLPTLVRFSGILRHRVTRLCGAFAQAMTQLDYPGQYTAVYPIKVNQQRRVVDQIWRCGEQAGIQVGLEAGSKPELMAVLALANRPGSTIVCNGYKDREYVRLALIGEKLGHRVFIVVEKPDELQRVVEQAQALQVMPRIGLRVRLASVGKSNWQNTGGEKSKFGLSASQVMAVLDRLKAEGHLDWVQMLHFHMGSQISQVGDIQRCMAEAAQFYVALKQAGAPVDTVDVGGGLGIDYEGTRSRSFCSMNYSLEEYASQIVRSLKEACEQNGLPYPNLITESGRALSAHHAVLLTNVIDVERPNSEVNAQPGDDDPIYIRELWENHQELHQEIKARRLVEVYHNVCFAFSECQQQFIHGVLTLQQRALAESLYYACCQRLHGWLNPSIKPHREIWDELNEKLADKLFLNFSLFQSTPDVWGIDQIFPLMPVTHLDHYPDRRAKIQDITCDSDGRIDLYVDGAGVESTLPIAERCTRTDSVLGIFLVGAYQEILGDMHNLFGDTNSVDVEVTGPDQFEFHNIHQGDTVDSVLAYVDFDDAVLLEKIEAQFRRSDISLDEQRELLQEMAEGLKGYTYLEE